MNIVIALGIVVTVATGLPVLFQMLRTHPRGLLILFFAEMWERFSYYGMRGILIFYLTQHFMFSDEFSGNQYGSYTSLVYLIPLIGGLMADRYLGTRKAIAFGALVLVAGHFTMAYEVAPAQQTLTYAGQTYEVQVEGRADDSVVRIMVDGQAYAFGPAAGGGIQLEGVPAGASLPPTLPAGTYNIETTRDIMGINVLYLALSLIIMGVGFLKPNISTIVGQLYPHGDPRRDSGFTLYYYGINLGAFWASILCGYLGQTVGWWAGFGLAGVGMLLGFIVFVLGKPLLQGHGEPPHPEKLREPVFGKLSREHVIYILGVLGVGAVWFLVQRNDLVGQALTISTFISLAAIVYIIAVVCKGWTERKHMLLAFILIFGAVIFFTLFEQAGTSLNLFADRHVDLNLTSAATQMSLFGYDFVLATRDQLAAAGTPPGIWIDTGITAAQTQSFNAGFILILAPIFAAMWAWLAKRGKDPNPTFKFGLALIQIGLGFLVVVYGMPLVDSSWHMPLFLLGLLYFLHTTGELCLSPVGLSEITKLSPASVVSFMMAVWFLSSSIAQYVGGIIAGWAGTETVGGQVLDARVALESSVKIFEMLAWWGIAAGGAYLVLSLFVRTWGESANLPRVQTSSEAVPAR